MTLSFHPELSTVCSEDRRYRYSLTHRWGPGPLVGLIGLSPGSIEGRRGGHFGWHSKGVGGFKLLARSLGFDGYTAGSLYARIVCGTRSPITSLADDPVGPCNDAHLDRIAASHDLIVFAWGDGADPQRARSVASRIWRQCGRGGGTVAVVGWTPNNQPSQVPCLTAGLPLRTLTAAGHQNFVEVDWRWSQLLADTTDVNPARSA